VLEESVTCVQVFKIEFKLFVETLLKIKWIKRSRQCIEQYHQFILCLLTAKPEFLNICTGKILSVFIPGDEDASSWKHGVPSEQLGANLQLVHDLIKKILEVIPMLPVTLRKKIREMFPYNKQESFKCAGYMYNILKILDYCPNMMNDTLETILET
jgi:RNA polymerase I-specific transcription initiation factor RRN3